MENNNQTEMKTIPTFTVLKNGSILKNIFLLNKQSSSSQDSDEQLLLVGRHPHCNITLEHPSISRYHLRIHSNPDSHTLSVIDLSSVHGTWVCGKRIKAGVYVKLKEGDTVKIGGSSRVYELHWVPVNEACGKEMHQGVGGDTGSMGDDLMCLDKIQDSPMKKLDQLVCSVSEYLSSDGDDTEEHSSSSNESNNKGEIFGTVLDQSELVVSRNVSELEDSKSLSGSGGQLDWLRDNLSSEFQMKDLYSEANCSKSLCDDIEVEQLSPWKTGYGIGEKFASGSVNWLRDDLSNESGLQNYSIIQEDLVPVPNCSKSSCDDTEVEYSSPRKAVNEIGEIFEPVLVQSPLVISEGISETEVSDMLNDSEDQLNGSRDNLSNEFELQNHWIVTENPVAVLNCLKSSWDDTEVEYSSPWKTENNDGELSTSLPVQSQFVVYSETGIFEYLAQSEDQSNWLRDNLSNEFEQLIHGTMTDDLTSVAVFEAIETLEKDAYNQDIARSSEIDTSNENEPVNQQETDNWLIDNLSNEFEHISRGTLSDDHVSVALFDAIKTHEKDALNQDIASSSEIDICNENELLDQPEIDNSSIPVAFFDGVKGDDEGSSMSDRAGGNEFNAGCEFDQMNQMNIMDESASVILFDGVDSKVLDDVDTGIKFELIDYEIMKKESVFVALPDGHSKVDDDVDTVVKFELIDFEIMNKESVFVALPDGHSKVDDDVDTGIKFESIDSEIMKKESVFVALPDKTDMDQEQTFTPVSRVKEVHMNPESVKNGSVSVNLFDSLDANELELFTPDKENKTPNARSVKSLLKRWEEAVSPIINEEKEIFGFSKKLFTSVDESNSVFATEGEKFVSDGLLKSMNTPDKVDPFIYCEEVLYPSEKEAESKQLKMEGSCNSINYPQTVQQDFFGGEKKRWAMVVDTNTLLHDESMKHLKLLEGLKGTKLFVPDIVIRELLDIQSTKKASLALEWIEGCMVNTSWCIPVDDTLNYSPQAEPILETALHLREEIMDRRIIILSNDLTLKIRAMAEGVMCEEAKAFRRSLVNPLSERFMWVGSSGIGPTWSSVNDVARQRYLACSLYGSHTLKGLRLMVPV